MSISRKWHPSQAQDPCTWELVPTADLPTFHVPSPGPPPPPDPMLTLFSLQNPEPSAASPRAAPSQLSEPATHQDLQVQLSPPVSEGLCSGTLRHCSEGICLVSTMGGQPEVPLVCSLSGARLGKSKWDQAAPSQTFFFSRKCPTPGCDGFLATSLASSQLTTASRVAPWPGGTRARLKAELSDTGAFLTT